MKKIDNAKNVTLLSDIDMKHIKYKILYGAIILVLLVFVFIALIPTVWIFMTGFKTTKEIYAVNPKFFPEQFSIETVLNIWNKTQIGTNVLATFVLAAGEIFSMLFVCGLAGYVISRLKPSGSKVLYMVILWTMMLPGTVRTVPLYMEFVKFPILNISLLDTYWPLILMSAANAYNIMLFKTFFDSVPSSIIEAARIDGCRELQIFLKIVVPMSLPIIIYTSIIGFNSVWSQFVMPMLVINNQKLQPIPVVIYHIRTAATANMPETAMALSIATLPPLIAFMFFQKRIVGGISIGGVKG